MKIMDMLSTAAGIGLISMAATMAVAQTEWPTPPFPSAQPCPGGTFTFPDGTTRPYDAYTCPWDKRCAVSGTFVAPNYYFVHTYCGPAAK